MSASRSAEDILLQMPHVKHKKNEGVLYVMSSRIAWMMKSKDSFSLIVKYTDIKNQKISPVGKPKIQLQVVMHDDNAITFHFVNPAGQDSQLKDRDEVKELLVNLLPKFKQKVNKELEDRTRLLSQNPGLLQLYKDLVITQIMKPEEFWAQHAPGALNNKLSSKNQVNGGEAGGSVNGNVTNASSSTAAPLRQEVGVSGSFLADIKPKTDGANGLKYNLTLDIMDSIFKTYPAVKRKHVENVPHNMSEQEFWTKFFHSHYFYRDRVPGVGAKDIFTACADEDDKSMKELLKRGVNDTVANIAGYADKVVPEYYGSCDGPLPGSQKAKKQAKNHVSADATNLVQRNIIKRFNQDSIMIMQTSSSQDQVPSTCNSENSQSASSVPNSSSNGINTNGPSSSSSAPNTDSESKPSTSRKRLLEKLEYEDLHDEDAAVAKKKSTKELNLAKVERYLNGPTPLTSEAFHTAQEVNHWRSQMRSVVPKWVNGGQDGHLTTVLTKQSALDLLINLSPGGSLMQMSRKNDIADQCPEAVKQDLRLLYSSLGELTRHFWACFPATTPELVQKATKMHDTLQKFAAIKLRPFENEITRNYTAISGQLTQHINQVLEAASAKMRTLSKRSSVGPVSNSSNS